MTEVMDFGWGIRVEHDDAALVSKVIDNGKLKTFKGETAWSDAERYAYDLRVKRPRT